MSGPRLEVDEKQFRKDWEAGVYIKDMAFLHGMSIQSVKNYAKLYGLTQRPPGPGRRSQDVALVGGEWVRNTQGIMVYIVEERNERKPEA